MFARFKQVTKSEGDGQHPSSHYLVVEDPKKPSTWHLRVRGLDGKPDHTLMGAAWAALHGGYRGNKYQGPNKAEALRKLMSLYRAEGMPMPGGKSLFYKAGDSLWFVGVYSNNFEDVEGDTFTEEAHREYAQWIKATGIKPPITVLHQPEYPDAVHIAHYMGLVRGQLSPEEFSNNLAKLYKPYAIAATKAVISMNGFNIVLGKVYDNKRELVEQLTERSNEWGMSHGFVVTKSDGAGTIHKYRSFEFSILPESMAANRVTTVGFVKGSNDMGAMLKGIDPETRVQLEKFLNDEIDPADVEEGTKLAKSLLSYFLGSKAAEEELETPVEEAEDKAKKPMMDDEEATEEADNEDEEDKEEADQKALDYNVLRGMLVEDFKIGELTQTLKAIDAKFAEIEAQLAAFDGRFSAHETDIKALKTSDDEKIAAAFNPPDWSLGLMGRSVATKNTAEEGDKNLLEDLKGDIPAEVDQRELQNNPLVLGLGNLFS